MDNADLSTQMQSLAEEKKVLQDKLDSLAPKRPTQPSVPYKCDTAILNDFITSDSFDYVMEKVKHSLFAAYRHKLSQDEHQSFLREHNDDDLTKAKELLAKHGYFAVENDVVASVEMENAIGEVERYLRNFEGVVYE